MSTFFDDETKEKLKNAKQGETVFINQGKPPFLILEGDFIEIDQFPKEGVIMKIKLKAMPSQEDRFRLLHSKKVQVEVFD